MRFNNFEWDEKNIEHIADHGVSPEELKKHAITLLLSLEAVNIAITS